MNSKIVKLERRDGIAVLTVDNPPVNTIDAGVRAGLFEALAELAAAQHNLTATQAIGRRDRK